MFVIRRYLTIILFFFTIVGVNAQQEVFTSYDLFKLKTTGEVAVSPNQDYIAYILEVPKPFDDDPGSNYNELHVYNIDENESTPVLTGEVNIYSISWMPDSKRILF